MRFYKDYKKGSLEAASDWLDFVSMSSNDELQHSYTHFSFYSEDFLNPFNKSDVNALLPILKESVTSPSVYITVLN